jgi:hypothetical protein
MAYTRHGHQIKGTPVDPDTPKRVYRCGGPRLCDQCAKDAQNTTPDMSKLVVDEQVVEKPATAYEQMNYCPIDGKQLTTVNGIKQCVDHPLVLFPSYVNDHGEQVMVFDPNRPGRV